MNKNIIKKITYARAGLLGNPSDGFNGKTISIPVKNFQAEVVLWPSSTLKFILNNEDQDEYEKVSDMTDYVSLNGYYGGIRLIKAAIVSFVKYCKKNKIILDIKNFTISYRSNIPRQSGLAGSSAIIVSTIKALMDFYGLEKNSIPTEVLANVALYAETDELGIAAGLQDRVVQAFGEPVYMDFSKEAFASNDGRFGNYNVIDRQKYLIPDLLLAWNNRPSESGKVHSDIKVRFANGEQEVIKAMSEFASFAEQGYEAMKKHDYDKIYELMSANFNLRLRLYGENVVGKENIRMVKLARSCSAAAKFPGSGGAVIIMPKRKSDIDNIIKVFHNNRYEIERIIQ